LELLFRDGAKQLPSLVSALITLLELDDIFMCDFLEVFLRIESLLGALVENNQVLNWRWLLQEVGKLIIELCNKHAKLSSPITQVIHAEDVVPEEF